MSSTENSNPSNAIPEPSYPEEMKIVNGHLAQSIREQGMLQSPNAFGYIHLAGEVEHPQLFRSSSEEKQQLLEDLKQLARELKEAFPQDVNRADIFSAFIIPPGSGEGRRVIEEQSYPVHVAEFDVVLMVECPDVELAKQVRVSEAFQRIESRLKETAKFTHCITAKNAKRIAEVDRDRDGVFLFNYFFASDAKSQGAKGVDVLLAVWEYTAGWWTANANLDNSTPLQPIDDDESQYSLINHCRWDNIIDIAPHLMFRPSMSQFVLANFTANNIAAMPILYHLVQ